MVLLLALLITMGFCIGLVTNGILERIIWVLTSALAFIFLKDNRSGYRLKIKRIAIGVISGYLLFICILYFFQYKSEVNRYIAKNHIGNTNKAVILVHEGEPATYQLPVVLRNQLEASKGIKILTLPFKLFVAKLNYEGYSSSSNNSFYTELKHSLSNSFYNRFTFYNSFLNQKPYFNEVLIKAMSDGNGEILVCPIILTEAHNLKEINDHVQKINPMQYKIAVKSTNALWDSDELATECISWLNGFIEKSQRSKAGILIIGEEYEEGKESNNYVKQGILFREKIKDLLVQEGYNSRHIKDCYLHRGLIINEMEALMAHAVKEIYVFQAASLYEDINYKRKIEGILKDIETPKEVDIHYITGWQYQNGIYNELFKRIKLLDMQI
ncbi:hypothetical protein F8154_01535 [Alkaliphilus pronyensis]|uniref:Ferrochelatase n=1 Tax=Alkaliphilus pronyensis TaxID=1482732 RepID=A0A6I0FE78_9FIRM|nr:hypothetical protein [Alkaliphilus pronyensis]KAB3538602.1 hypothetical protein F8154_01535 [Alkaliphilus pronyensis]